MKICRTFSISSPDPERRYFRYPEAAAYINGTVWFVRTLVWRGELPCSLIGKRHVIDKRDLDVYMENAKMAVK